MEEAVETAGPEDRSHGRGFLSRRPLLVGAAVVLAVLAAAGGFLLGARATAGPQTPAEGSVEAGFARDMSAHHAQAVEMSVLVRDRTEDEEVRRLALDIILTQQQQLGQMYGWLELWELPQASPGQVMEWTAPGGTGGHGDSGRAAGMPGMATRDELNELRSASGRQAERLYLDLMIAHHQGGVEMARYAADNAETPAVTELAGSMVRAQNAELDVLASLLAARGGPLPD